MHRFGLANSVKKSEPSEVRAQTWHVVACFFKNRNLPKLLFALEESRRARLRNYLIKQ